VLLTDRDGNEVPKSTRESDFRFKTRRQCEMCPHVNGVVSGDCESLGSSWSNENPWKPSGQRARTKGDGDNEYKCIDSEVAVHELLRGSGSDVTYASYSR
jgi:hypothetical protein